jgi:prepilin-type N-terminal cleavage/methylation domain-containing protein
MCSPRKQQGFTLIELVVVIVILGILAATAAPKFIDLASDAKKANRSALLGAIKSAITMGHSKCLVDANCSTSGESSTTVNGTVIAMRNGYPAPHNGIALLVYYEDWVVRSGSVEDFGALFRYPGTTWPGSDCTIYYHHRKHFSEPRFEGYNYDTCS